MTFLWPYVLAAVALVPLGVLVVRRIDRGRHGRVTALTGTPAAVAASRRARPADRVAPMLVALALVVLIIAAARPQATVALPRPEGTLMLTFDVSASMGAEDVAPSRLHAAKVVAGEIVEQKPAGVVIGVVAFSNAAMSVQPPTDDTAAVLAAIERMAPTDGTSLGSGILATLDAVDRARAHTPAEYYSNRSPEPTPVRRTVPPGSDTGTVIVVLSDGENTANPDPLEAAQQVADRGIRMITIGVGTVDGFDLDLDGFLVHSILDEANLEQMAELTDGWYRAAADGDVARAVYDELALHLVAREELEELTAPVAALGLLLLVLGAGVSLIRAGRLP